MELKDVIFIDNLPKLDLHGFDRETAIVSTNDFINDNKKMKNEIFVIIHGIGSGIIRKTVHETLRKNKNVLDYKTFYNNNGSTIVKIKI
jgi:DNA mismatch repair protein MutS2